MAPAVKSVLCVSEAERRTGKLQWYVSGLAVIMMQNVFYVSESDQTTRLLHVCQIITSQ